MATKKNNNVNGNMSNETKVICPVCGSEFAIGAHEHQVKNATVIGMDSGLGTIALPVSKVGMGRIAALQAAGVDTSKYFSIQLPTGGEQLMTYDADGVPVAVSADDPIMQNIVRTGTVPNRNLFRRWIMSQVFHGLTAKNYHGDVVGFSEWLKGHGYKYMWEQFVEELRVQAKLYGKDPENFAARNRWFNKDVAIAMANDHIEQVRKDADERDRHKCKGVPYIKYDNENIFVSDIEKKLIAPMIQMRHNIATAKTPQELYYAVRSFANRSHINVAGNFDQCQAWKDAYKGMGAYATMQNLLRFHGCTFPKDNDFYKRGQSGLVLLERAAKAYEGEGWRLFGLMKQMLEENGIDIKAKMREWQRAKKK